MPNDHSTSLDLARPRTVAEILATALRLYVRYPLLFILLALVVVAPYELIVLAVAHVAPLGQQTRSASTALLLTLIEFALIGPFVSALQVQAVLRIGEGRRPSLSDVLAQSLRVLPVVVAAEIVAGIGIGIGLILFIVPGVILALRWAVVAQAAAIEQTDWPTALRRSAALTSRNYLRIFALLFIVSLVILAIGDGVGEVTGTSTAAPNVVLGIAVLTLIRSFQTLTLAVLYFDLRARETELARMA